jgi:hypothetical protein
MEKWLIVALMLLGVAGCATESVDHSEEATVDASQQASAEPTAAATHETSVDSVEPTATAPAVTEIPTAILPTATLPDPASLPIKLYEEPQPKYQGQTSADGRYTVVVMLDEKEYNWLTYLYDNEQDTLTLVSKNALEHACDDLGGWQHGRILVVFHESGRCRRGVYSGGDGRRLLYRACICLQRLFGRATAHRSGGKLWVGDDE